MSDNIKLKMPLSQSEKNIQRNSPIPKVYWAGGKQWCAGRLTTDNITDLIAELEGNYIKSL